MNPKTIAFMDVRQMRTRAMVNLPMGTVVSILPGQPLESTQIIADPIEKAFDLWVRLRAYLYTLAYVSILDPDWFPYQAAVAVSEQLLVYITDTHLGHSPDMDFLVSAWGSTSLYFSEAVRVQKKDPEKIFTDIGKWQHKWSWVPAPPLAALQGAPPDSRAAPQQREPDNHNLQSKLDTVTGQVKRLQAAADRAERNSGRGSARSSGYERPRNEGQYDPPAKNGKGKGCKKGGKNQSGQRQTPSGWKKRRTR